MASSKTAKIDLLTFNARLKEKDDKVLKDWVKDDKCIPRDELTSSEIANLTEILDFILKKMDQQQRDVYESMRSHSTDDKYNIFDRNEKIIKNPITILNAPAGTGKTFVTLAYQISVNLDFGFKNGAIMYTPSYASHNAVVSKIKECFEELYTDEEIIDQKSNCVCNCLYISIINKFYACGPQSFNIHDPCVSAKVIQKFSRAKCSNEYDRYKINNVQAIRETRAIIIDEAFYSTQNRCRGFIDMLMDGYINHPYMNKEIRTEFPSLLDHLVFLKKIIFSGDPYQLSVSVESKDPGVEKYLNEQGDPMWFLKNQLRDRVRLSENVHDPAYYQLLTLDKNYRFDTTQVPEDLIKSIMLIRKVVYNGEEGFDKYKKKMGSLLNLMSKYDMIEFGVQLRDVADKIDKEEHMVVISEIHKTSTEINGHLDKKYSNKEPPLQSLSVKSEFIYGDKKTEGNNMKWIPYDVYSKSIPDQYKNDFELRYKNECKNGSIANKFIGCQYPGQKDREVPNKLYMWEKVRITFPLKGKRDQILRILNHPEREILSDDFILSTGTYGRVVGFEGTTVHIEIRNEEDSNKYNNILKGGKQLIKINGIETSNPVFAIKYSKDLSEPYFKSAFCDYIIREKSFNLAVHSYPFTKESASTIASLQGGTFGRKTKIIYHMHSITKKDLDGSIIQHVGEWKGSLPNLLYVAITRSKLPHTNFMLTTAIGRDNPLATAKNITKLLEKITSGKRPKSYTDLKQFNLNFERIKVKNK